MERTAYGINQLCGSGLRAVALGSQAIRLGDADIIVAGGQESMSQAPHCMHLRNGTKMGSAEMVDTMLRDGLLDAFHGYHMGNTAENVAGQWQITREQQDEFAAHSQQKAEQAMLAGRFVDEIVPVTIKGRKGDTVVDVDEYPKHGTTTESLGKLRPLALTMPAVTVWSNPNGEPIANTHSPTFNAFESPNSSIGKSSPSILIRAISESLSEPITSATNSSPSVIT